MYIFSSKYVRAPYNLYGGDNMEAIKVGALALLAEGLGVAIGILLLYLFNIKNKRIIGMLFGATSGIMIAMICFDILPEALHTNQNTLVILGAGIGICLGLLLEDFTEVIQLKLKSFNSKMMGTAFILLLGIGIHNIPEGFALGTVAVTSADTLLKFAFVICLHSIPEAIALAIPLKAANTNKKLLFSVPIILGSIMGVGAILGYLLSQIASGFITTALGIAAGIILYIVCQELLPESRRIWNGRMTTVATILGILLGMFLVV